MKNVFTSNEQPKKLIARRQFLQLSGATVAALTIPPITGCGSGSKKVSTAATKKVTIMSNPTDAMVMKVYPKAGSVISAYGSRDSNGYPLTVDRMVIVDGTDTTRYAFNADGSASKMTAADGTQFTLDWKSTTTAAVTIRTGDGKNQISTLVDFTATKAARHVVHTDRSVRSNLNTGFSAKYMPASDIPCGTPQRPVGRVVSRQQSTNTCQVSVTQCGGLASDNDEVWVRVMSNGQNVGEYPAVSAGGGKYVATLPSKIALTFNPGEFIKNLVSSVDNVCTWTEGYRESIPLALEAALYASGIPGVNLLVAGIVAAATAVMAALELYCDTVGYSPSAGADSFLYTLLDESDFLNQDFDYPTGLSAYVIALPENVFSTAIPAPANGPYPDLSIDLGGLTTIRSLTLNPDAPAAFTDYVGTADIYCLLTGTNVTLSIVGTDGYTNSQAYTVASGQVNGTYTLSVPGASTGVQDVVTVTVTPPTGTPTTLTASLIFG